MMDAVENAMLKHQTDFLKLCNSNEDVLKEANETFLKVNTMPMSELGTIGMETMSQHADYITKKMVTELEDIRNEYISRSKKRVARDPTIGLNMTTVANFALICLITNDVECWNNLVPKVQHNRTLARFNNLKK